MPCVSAPPVLVEVTREGFVESRHRGHLVVVDAAGHVVVSAGEVAEQVYPRSSLKPLQAVAMISSGFTGRGAALALASASHAGEPMHLDGVAAILAAAGLDRSVLQCPPALPRDPAARIDWIRAGHTEDRMCHNCSGKHAAMLATCVAAGWSLDDYRSPAHPLQVTIRETIAALCGGEAVDRVTVDGCGAPAFSMSLLGLARAFSALGVAGSTAGAGGSSADGSGAGGSADPAADSAADPAALVAAAMRHYPELVSGTAEVTAALPADVPGLISKGGAEGVWAAALPDGRAFAAKIDDGGERAQPAVLAAVVRAWGFDGPAVRAWANVPTLGGGQPIGEIRPSEQLTALLSP